MNKNIVLLIIPVLFTHCTNQNSEVIVLKNIVDEKIEIPMEVEISDLKNTHLQIKATSVKNPEISFVLQKGTSIHQPEAEIFSTILPNSIIAGEYAIASSNEKPLFSFDETEPGRLTIKENGNPTMSYNFGMQLPEGVPERYRRSTYVHPIYDLHGNVLTDDFPDDHYHHRGLSWMWPKVFIDSVRYDLWHIYGQQGDLDGIHQVFEKWLNKDVGPVFASIGAKNIWQLDNGQQVMDEWVYIKVYKAVENTRSIDIKLVLRANVQIALEGQTKKGYGGLNFRFAPREETVITSQFGVEEDSDLKKLPWADESAKFGGNDTFSGVSIFQHAKNKNFPAGWCLRHYGFLGVAWPGVERYNMNLGDKLTLSFRILIHQGDAEDANVENAYKIFSDPPIIELK